MRSAGETGQLYGSVSTRDIAELLIAEGFSVNRNQILLNQPIKTIGLTNVAIALHPEVEVTITLNIARTADEAERAKAKGETLTTAEAILWRRHQRQRGRRTSSTRTPSSKAAKRTPEDWAAARLAY